MAKKEVNYTLSLIIILIASILWQLDPPSGLKTDSWHLFIIFIATISGIISSAMTMGAITISAVAALVLTKILTIKEAMHGFASPTLWLVVMAFFIARGFIKTNLGKRIAYFLISKLGRSNIGLSYSLIFTEFILAPMIPSTSARGGGIIYPITKSLAEEYDKIAGKLKSQTGGFLIAVCFHANVVCCALFLTSMAGNPLIVSLAASIGIQITWTKWAIATIIPGTINLVLLPVIMSCLIESDIKISDVLVNNAKESLQEMGKITSKELTMIGTFILLLFLWIFGSKWGIDSTTAGIVGFLILIATQIIKWDDVISEKPAWDTLIWFAILLMLADNLTKFGVDRWIEDQISFYMSDYQGLAIICALAALYFFIHYLFASITAHITVMFLTFLLLLTKLGVPPMAAAMLLAILSNLSGGLTHYGINTAPIFFGAGYFTTSEWFKIGFIVSCINALIWIISGGIWWKILGWW